MEQTYSIEWLEKVHVAALNKDKYKLSLKDSNGATLNDITMWQDFEGFSDFKPGSTITGELRTSEKNGYKNTTIYAVKPKVASGAKFGPSGGMKMMEKKAEYIEKAQERKNDSIAFFNATNSALTLYEIMNQEIPDGTGVKEFIREWRTWFLKEWENYNDKPPF